MPISIFVADVGWMSNFGITKTQCYEKIVLFAFSLLVSFKFTCHVGREINCSHNSTKTNRASFENTTFA